MRPHCLLLLLPFGLFACDDGAPKETGEPAGDTGEVNEAPALTIDAPQAGAAFAYGDIVTLSGFAVDDRDAAASLSLAIEDDLDGALGTVTPDAAGTWSASFAPSVGAHTIVVSVTDADGASADASVAFTVEEDVNPGDEPPSTPEIHIEPGAPITGDGLALVFDQLAVDPEGYDVTYTIAWTVDGGDAGNTGEVVDAGLTVRGEVWAVTVVASDGVNDSDVATAQVVVGNAPPNAADVVISPAAPTIADTLSCSIDGVTDAEYDGVSVTYSWTVDGVAAGADSPLPAGVATAGAEVVCTVTLDDGYDTAVFTSDPVVIVNTAPGTPTVEVTPAEPLDTEDLACVVTVEATDPDGDVLAYTWAWYADGVLTAETGSTVAATATHRDEVWTCEVTAVDPGGLTGTPGSAAVTVGIAWTGEVSAATADIVIDHTVADAAFGKTVTLLGDMDGDGRSEVLVSADDENGEDGAVYLFPGSALSGTVTSAVATASWAGAWTDGQLGGYRSVTAPGDLDADGVPELFFAAAEADANGNASGEAYLYYGGGTWGLGEDPSFADARFVGTASDEMGARLTTGDIDGDGWTDIVVAAPGASDSARSSGSVAFYLNDGARWSGAYTVADADTLVTGNAETDQLGWTTKFVGDTDGDGYVDLFTTAIYDDDNGQDAGVGGLVLGGSLSSGTHALSSAAAAIFSGDSAGDRFGYDVVGDVDVDGDGNDDLFIGAYRDDDAADDVGSVQVYLGRRWGTEYDVADADVRIVGTSASAYFGHVMASPGDLDSDGTDDLVIGALFDSPTGLTYQGSAWVLLGPDWASASAPSDIPWHAYGEAASDLFGDALGFGRGDVDGDGLDDFAVGAQGNDSGASGAGRVYIWRGR